MHSTYVRRTLSQIICIHPPTRRTAHPFVGGHASTIINECCLFSKGRASTSLLPAIALAKWRRCIRGQGSSQPSAINGPSCMMATTTDRMTDDSELVLARSDDELCLASFSGGLRPPHPPVPSSMWLNLHRAAARTRAVKLSVANSDATRRATGQLGRPCFCFG